MLRNLLECTPGERSRQHSDESLTESDLVRPWSVWEDWSPALFKVDSDDEQPRSAGIDACE